MEVILLENVRNVGTLGERVSVKPGYGRNFLIPKKLAVMATKANLEAFEARRAELEAKAAETKAAAESRAAAIAALEMVTIAQRAGDEGKLFGSVGPADIAAAVTEAGTELAKAEVAMPTGSLRQTGEYEVELHLHPDVVQALKVTVVAE